MIDYNADEKEPDDEPYTNSIEETAALVLRQSIIDSGLGVTVATETNDLVVWDEETTICHVHTVTNGAPTDKTAMTEGGTPTVVADVTGDEWNAVTSWTFVTPDDTRGSKAGLLHYLVEVAA